MKTCKACGKTISIYQRAYCSRECAMSGGKQRRREHGPSRRLSKWERVPEVEAAEEALRVLRLEMEATKTPVRARSSSLAQAEALACELGDHGAERAMLRECALTGHAQAIRQAASPGGVPA